MKSYKFHISFVTADLRGVHIATVRIISSACGTLAEIEALEKENLIADSW